MIQLTLCLKFDADVKAADLVPHYEFEGCYKDRGWPRRAFKGYDDDSDDNSLEWCLTVCLNQNRGKHTIRI